MNKNIFIFDQNKCIGCHACVIACINENGFQSPEQWRNVHKSQENHFPDSPLFYLSIACNHCDNAPCMKNCPTLAYSRDEKTGAIVHHPEKCIGCKYCTWACPYDAPKYNPKSGIVEKCTFCNHKIEEELKPACANLCPVGALDFSNTVFTIEESKASSPVPVEVGSNIKINKLRNKSGPEIDLDIFKNQQYDKKENLKHEKISAKEEWPLVIFTLLSAILVSLYASQRTELFRIANKFIYLGLGVISALLSMLHLGKKFRVWRSVLNQKNSWLSKEILSFALFFVGVLIDFFLIDISNVIIIFFGVILLISIDMLYSLATWRWPIKMHSAQTLFIGITFYAALTSSYLILAFILAFRLTIYFYKSINSLKIIHTLRIILPIASFGLLLNQQFILPLALLLIGEIIDRIEFYNELNVPDPKKEFQG